MAQNEYIVEDRVFRTEGDYKRALRDKDTIDKLRVEAKGASRQKLENLLQDLESGKYKFFTLLGQDFEDEIRDQIKKLDRAKQNAEKTSKGGGLKKIGSKESGLKKNGLQKNGWKKNGSQKQAGMHAAVQVTDADIKEALQLQEKRRKQMIIGCSVLAVLCLGYLVVYSFFNQRTDNDYEELLALKEKAPIASDLPMPEEELVIHYTEEEYKIAPNVLDEYKNLVIKNKKLIGWVKIDDTNIDYPVMQTTDNEYYLDHNLNQEYDKNGSIFMDKDCNVLKPSTNFILYGHHMKSGKMFGSLPKYSDPKYYQTHKYIDFDTIYEKGIYEVMYVFRSRVYSEQEVVFKYYQFIDAMSEVEFQSNMQEMAAVSLYDTGVTASYGDRLLTLSTCDYQEKNGRFVVVAKKVSEKE